MAYDIEESRVAKVLKIARKYLNWVQNSVLEGEITKAKFERLKVELKKVINDEKDSIIFYILPTTRYSERQIMGKQKSAEELII